MSSTNYEGRPAQDSSTLMNLPLEVLYEIMSHLSLVSPNCYENYLFCVEGNIRVTTNMREILQFDSE